MNIEDSVDELLEEMDELIGEHNVFTRAEGDDGPYAWDIYHTHWSWERFRSVFLHGGQIDKMLYWVDGSIEDYRVSDEQQEEIYNRICTRNQESSASLAW
jgi:hypothetical protein